MPLLGLGRGRRTAGLDIGAAALRLAVVDHGRDEPQLEAVATRPVAESAVVEGELVGPRLVSDGIRELFSRASLEPESLAISVGGRDVIVTLIRMDRMDATDAREVIRWEAERHVPFDTEDVELDFQIADPDGAGRQMKVLLVAAERELVESRMGLVREAGFDPDVVDVDAFALFNALERNYPEAMEGTTALVEIGHEGTSATLVEDGVPVLTRELAFGVRRLSRELQSERGLGPSMAGRVLRGEVEASGLESFVADRATELARGVERATTSVERPRLAARPGRLYLCGGGAAVPGLPAALAERLGIETHLASPVRRVQVKADALADGELEEAAPALMLALGLGLRRPA